MTDAEKAAWRAGVEACVQMIERLAEKSERKQCCGVGVQSSISSPPECCGEPIIGIDADAAIRAIRALEGPPGGISRGGVVFLSPEMVKMQIAAAIAAEREACKALVTMDAVAKAMQHAWDDFCDYTDCFPDCFSLRRGKIAARFGVGNFASMVTTRLRDEIDRARGEAET